MSQVVLDLRTAGFAWKACRVCGWRFFTFGGLYEHSLTCRPRPRKHGPAGLAVLRERGRQIAALNNSRRRCCDGCGLTTTPAALGVHQRHTGHTGWTDA